MFQIEVTQDEITGAIDRLLAATDDLTPVMQAIGGVLVNRIRTDFDQSQDPYGNPWAPLKFRNGQPLRDTGRLRNSIDFDVPGTNVVEVGTNVAYAPVHQFGAKIPAHGGDTPSTPGNVSIDGFVASGAPVLLFSAGGRIIAAKRVEIPARPFFPTEDGGLPDSWGGDILDTLNGYFLNEALAA